MKKYDYAPGDKPFDDYTIQYALGRGGFGEVYFAKSAAGREVALKAILNHEETELRGVQNCMNLKSTRLLTIYDVKRASDGVLWIVMEFVRGPSLQDIIRASPDGLSTAQATYLLRELALALSDLHNAGIVHRDLKPSNIFFDNGNAKIGDYSLSKTISHHEQSQHTLTVGSVHYMAPEISLGRYDKTVDIYALGVIFFELLTGHPPHTGETLGEILLKHLHSDVDVNSIDERFQSVILRAMNREASERYRSAEELASDALASVHQMPLDNSFSPATLSLIGDRARERRASERSAASSGLSPNINVGSALSDNESILERDVKESHRPPSTRSLEMRLCMAMTLALATTTFAILADNRAGLGAIDGLMFGVATFFAAMASAYSLFRATRVTPQNRGRIAKQRVLTAAVGSGLLAFVAAWLTPLELEGLLITAIGSGVALTMIDWGNVAAFDRPSTLQWYPTIGAGVIAAAICLVLRMADWWIFSASTVVGIALALQAVAPLFDGAKSTMAPKARDGVMPVPVIPNSG